MRRTLMVTAVVVLALAIVLPWQGILAQEKPAPEPHKGLGMCHIPKLTEEQKQKIEELRASFLKEVQPLRSQLRSERFALLSLLAADKPDQKAINAKIDALAKLRADIQKKEVAHRLQVRGLLTEEQKAAFDARPGLGWRCMEGRPGPRKAPWVPRRGPGMTGHRMHGGECPMRDMED